MVSPIRVGTRGSALALAQTGALAKELAKAAGCETELVTVTTHGDTSTASLASMGGTGVFASALREALLEGEVDVVVHSLKDLPTAPYPGLTVAAIPRRADARDVLVATPGLTLDTLPAKAKVGTGSPRRAAQVRAARPDTQLIDLRGNVDSRIAKVTSGELDAVVLAAAGLGRLSRGEAAVQAFDLNTWPTAPGQGALAVEVATTTLDRGRTDTLTKALTMIDHATSRAVVAAEREVLARLEAGCAAPVATHAMVDDGMFFLTATVYSLDGNTQLVASHAAVLDSTSRAALLAAATEVAERTAAELLAAGAADLVNDAKNETSAVAVRATSVSVETEL